MKRRGFLAGCLSAFAAPAYAQLVHPASPGRGRKAVASGGTLPSDFSGLFMWYDFSDSATVSLSGSDITQITDKSGNSHTMAT